MNSLELIEQFQKDAESLKRDKNSLSEFKQWIEAQKKEAAITLSITVPSDIVKRTLSVLKRSGYPVVKGKANEAVQFVVESVIATTFDSDAYEEDLYADLNDGSLGQDLIDEGLVLEQE